MLLLPFTRVIPAWKPIATFLVPRACWSAATPTAVFLLPEALARSTPPPTAVLRPPVSLLKSAWIPMAVFVLPLVLLKSALNPLAVLLMPMVLWKSAWSPLAVLLLPVLLKRSASLPLAVLPLPVVLLESAPSPNAVFSQPAVTPQAPNSPTFWSEPVPPATLPFPSLSVGLQPGLAQRGGALAPPQLGVMLNSITRLATGITRRAMCAMDILHVPEDRREWISDHPTIVPAVTPRAFATRPTLSG